MKLSQIVGKLNTHSNQTLLPTTLAIIVAIQAAPTNWQTVFVQQGLAQRLLPPLVCQLAVRFLCLLSISLEYSEHFRTLSAIFGFFNQLFFYYIFFCSYLDLRVASFG